MSNAPEDYTCFSLCSGIGGIDLAFEYAGFKIVGQVENDPFCISILEKHWHGVYRIEDMNEAAAHPEILPSADIICGGIECQPFSYAGKRRGKQDHRYLWPQTFQIVRAVRPRIVFVENVPGIINLALDTILTDLESEQFTCWTFNIPACAIGSVHIRKRIFIVGYAEGRGEQDKQKIQEVVSGVGQPERSDRFSVALGDTEHSGRAGWPETTLAGSTAVNLSGVSVGNADATGLPFGSGFTQPSRRPIDSIDADVSDPDRQSPIGTAIARQERIPGAIEPGMVRDVHGFSGRLDRPQWPAPYGAQQYDYEPPRTVKGYRGRAARIKSLGNAVVPQVVIPFAQTIREILETEDRQQNQSSVDQRKID